jgi:hypothetical protein
MSKYFAGIERMQIFEKTGTAMRMGLPSELDVSDYQVLRNLVTNNRWEEAIQYLTSFHAQNMFMNSVYFEWSIIIADYYTELTSKESYKKVRPLVLADYKIFLESISKIFHLNSEKEVMEVMGKLYEDENLSMKSADFLFAEMEKDFQILLGIFKEKDIDKALGQITTFHHHAVIRHDSLSGFIYSFPTTVVRVDGEKLALELSNGSVLRNQKWLGLWELSKLLSPLELAAFLAEHLRFHFSGDQREGKTTIVEDENKIRLIFDPCGSGGAIRRRLGSEVVNLQEKHQLAWNKCGEVNLYCSHCALNELYSIEQFGYPKLVVEFQADPNKACGWTIYKNKEDVPEDVYKRLGPKKP